MKAQLFNKLGKGLAETMYYQVPYLRQDATSEDFFKSISYPVELQGLHKIRKTCYYHQAFEWCPVLIEITDARLIDEYSGKYLLQVWDKKGTKCFEKILQYEIRSWNIFTEHFVFMLHPEEAGAEYIYVVNMAKKAATFRVKDFLNDSSFKHLGVCNSCLYVGNDQEIRVVDINIAIADGETSDHEFGPTQVASYNIGDQCKLHGFFENQFAKEQNYLMCQIEVEDNQFDFARFYFWSREIEKADFSFYQYTEVVHRQVRLDPIVKYRQIILETQFQFGVALRESGKIDIYWNHKIVNSPDELFVDVDITFEKIYLTRADGTKCFIETKHDTRVGMDQAEPYSCTPLEWERLFYYNIKDHVAFYSSFCLINTSFFISHGNILSLYDIVQKSWIKHFYVEEKVLKVFRNEKDDDRYNVGAYLESGRIKLIDSTDTSDPETWELVLNQYGTAGTPYQYVSDQEDYRNLYILTKLDDGTINLYGFSREVLYIYNTLVHELKETTRVVPFFAPADHTQFILLNKDEGDLRVYDHYWENGTFYLSMKKHCKINVPSTITGEVSSAMSTDIEKYIFLTDQSNFYKLDVVSGALTVYDQQNVGGLQFLDNTFCYTLNNVSTKNKKQGFYVYDIQNLIDQDTDKSYLLDEALVGVNNLIDFSDDNQRLAYMKDYDTIQIVPSLHRNTINFMGMTERSNYIACKKIKDKFIALDKRNIITTWSIMTGKIEKQHKLLDIDLSSYDIFSYEDQDVTYKREWYQPRCLLMQKEGIEGYDEEKFFPPDMLRTSLKNNKNYVNIMAKTFHNFKMIEIMNEYEIKEHFTFIHPFYGKGNYQRIYLSNDLEYMLERLINQRVFLYKKIKGTHGMVKWEMVKRIQNFPMDMSELTYNNYLFSPDLMYYLDYDRKSNGFLIKNTLTGKPYCVIPSGLMSAGNEDGSDAGESLKETAQTFMWIDCDTVKIISKQGIEKIVDIRNGFEEIAYASVPLFNKLQADRASTKHYYFHKKQLPISSTLERLQRKYQAHKSIYYLEEKREAFQIYEEIFNIDYSIDDAKYKFVSELSFTFLHWKLIEEIAKDKTNQFRISSIDNSQVELLAYNILPGCQTILHKCAQKQDVIRDIYETSKKIGEEFEVPFIQNIKGQSPIHVCLQFKEYKTVDMMLAYLSDEPVDHHGRAIVDTLPELLEAGLTNVATYMNSRFRQTDQYKSLRSGCLNTKQGLNYAYTTGALWDDSKVLERELFQVSPVDSVIRLEYLDLPYLHCFKNDSGDKFMEALANCESIEFFNYRSIQTIIDYKWPLVKEYTIKKLFFPFALYLILFFYYSNYIYENITIGEPLPDPDNWTLSDKIVKHTTQAILLILSAYFMLNEFKQLVSSGFDYLLQVWNYLDLIPPIMITTIIILNLASLEFDFLKTMIALSSLLLWFKLLYFLRIFKSTGYLVRMIIQVVIDMRIFLVVLSIIFLGFADAFISLSQGTPDPSYRFVNSFIESVVFTYRIGLGDLQDPSLFENNVQPLTTWLLFLLCSLLNIVVMLNLLIAIISDSYANIQANATLNSMQERARIIAENSYLIPDEKMIEISKLNKYLLVALNVEDLNANGVVDSLETANASVSSLKLDERLSNLEKIVNEKFDQVLNEIKK